MFLENYAEKKIVVVIKCKSNRFAFIQEQSHLNERKKKNSKKKQHY